MQTKSRKLGLTLKPALKIGSKPYEIQKLAESDDGSHAWPWYRKALPKYFGTPVSIAYFMFQARFIWILGSLVWRAEAGNIWSAKLFVFIHISQYFASLVEDAWPLLAAPRKKPQIRLVGDNVPKIDVNVTTCKEGKDVIMDTVRGLCALNYHTDRFRVLVADYGADKRVKEEVEELSGKVDVPLYYYAAIGQCWSQSWC